jgi:single-strand DNA-binding protein
VPIHLGGTKMSRGLNKVLIIGRLGRDPEMRYTPSGRPVTTFSVATSRSWNTADGERRTETEWFNVVAWGSLAEICKQYLCKNRLVYIEGRLQSRHWEDPEGNKHFSTEIVANEMIMLDEKREGNQLDQEEVDTSENEEVPFKPNDKEFL